MSAPRRRRGRSGFTLLELLAATLLFALIGTLLFQVVRGALDVWSIGERNRELHDRSSAVFDVIAEDLRGTWLGSPGRGEQDARFLCTWREEAPGEDGRPGLRAPLLRFARLCHEERTLAWLRRAGERPGGEAVLDLSAEQDPGALLPTSGLAETLVTLARLPGRELPALLRAVRAPLGGRGSLLAEDLVLDPGRLLAGALPLADDVLWFGAEFWGPATTAWEGAGEGVVPALAAWDSTRGLLPPGDPDFPYGAGRGSLADGHDDVLPRLVRLTLVLDVAQAAASAGALAQPLTAAGTRLELQSAAFLRDEDRPDHVLVGEEWMAVRGLDGRVLEVERGRRGTSAAAHDAGARVRTGRRFERVVEIPAAREHWGGGS